MVVKVTCKTNYLFSERKINRDITGNEKKNEESQYPSECMKTVVACD